MLIEYQRPFISWTSFSFTARVLIASKTICSRSGMTILVLISLRGRPMSGGIRFSSFSAASLNRLIWSSLPSMIIGILTPLSTLDRSLFKWAISSLRVWSSSLTVVSSSLVDWSSSLAVSSSSLMLCISSLLDCSSSFSALNSSFAASYSAVIVFMYALEASSSSFTRAISASSGRPFAAFVGAGVMPPVIVRAGFKPAPTSSKRTRKQRSPEAVALNGTTSIFMYLICLSCFILCLSFLTGTSSFFALCNAERSSGTRSSLTILKIFRLAGPGAGLRYWLVSPRNWRIFRASLTTKPAGLYWVSTMASASL